MVGKVHVLNIRTEKQTSFPSQAHQRVPAGVDCVKWLPCVIVLGSS